MALRENRAVRAGDVLTPEWRHIYEPFWPDTRGELAVPICIEGALVREGPNVVRALKRIGAINLESADLFAFSEADEVLLSSLARHVAVVIDRMDLDRKLAALARGAAADHQQGRLG